jgi:uncharacterized protein YcfL
MPKAMAMRTVGLVMLASVFVAGCSSTQARRVDCDGPLVPINVAAPTASTALPTALAGKDR